MKVNNPVLKFPILINNNNFDHVISKLTSLGYTWSGADPLSSLRYGSTCDLDRGVYLYPIKYFRPMEYKDKPSSEIWFFDLHMLFKFTDTIYVKKQIT